MHSNKKKYATLVESIKMQMLHVCLFLSNLRFVQNKKQLFSVSESKNQNLSKYSIWKFEEKKNNKKLL